MARTSSKKINYAKIAEEFGTSKATQNQLKITEVTKQMKAGLLPIEMIKWLKMYGVNEAEKPLRWSRCFEEGLRLVADLRIGEVYTTGCAQLMKGNRNEDSLYTPKGWRKAGDIRPGDQLIDCDGNATLVTAINPLGLTNVYTVVFNDGTKATVTDEHLWEWKSPRKQKPRVSTTLELIAYAEKHGYRQLKKDGKPGRYNITIPSLTAPVQMDNGFDFHGLDPYALGLLLGDGSVYSGVVISGLEKDLETYKQYFESCHIVRSDNRCATLRIQKLTPTLRKLKVFGMKRDNKTLHQEWLESSIESRLALLQGLMDTDGTCIDGGARFDTISKGLAEGVAELTRSLAGFSKVIKHYRSDWDCHYYTVSVYLPKDMAPFRLKRKLSKYKYKKSSKRKKRVASIEYAGKSDCTCFVVDNPRHLYTMPGGIVTHNTVINALVNAYFGQVAGLRTGWAFPESKMIDVNVPAQHTKILANNAKVAGATRNRDSKTSNRYYDMGIGSNRFHALIAGKGSAAQGTGIISYTADVCFAEEASQVKQAMIKPLISRVEHSISHQMPLRYLGTKGSGAGIEQTIKEKAERVFWPHMICPHCGEEIVLDPRGTLLLKSPRKNKKGEVEYKYLSELGTPVDYHKDEEGNPYFACPHCTHELDQHSRVHDSYFKCIKTGVTVPEFLKIVDETWVEHRHLIAIECSCLLRDKPTKVVAKTIITEGQSPSGAADWCQQQLGLVSDFGVSNITENQWIEACQNEPPQGSDWYTLGVYGADQGRSQWWGSYLRVHFKPLMDTNGEIADNAVFEVVDMTAATSDESCEYADRIGVDCGMIDNEPSVREAARLCEIYDFRMGDQIWNQKDDFKLGTAMDAGYQHLCYKLRDGKFGYMILQAFLEGRVVLPAHWKDFVLDNSLYSPAKHLRGVSWDPEEGKIEKATDDIDHWFFAMMFAVAAFVIYLEDPSSMERGLDLDWV